MSMNFSFNDREIKKMAQPIVRDEAEDLQRRIDALSRRYRGHSVEEIKPALHAEWRKGAGTMTEPELTDWATLISNGTRIEFKAR